MLLKPIYLSVLTIYELFRSFKAYSPRILPWERQQSVSCFHAIKAYLHELVAEYGFASDGTAVQQKERAD